MLGRWGGNSPTRGHAYGGTETRWGHPRPRGDTRLEHRASPASTASSVVERALRKTPLPASTTACACVTHSSLSVLCPR